MTRPRVAIVSLTDDFHALDIQQELRAHYAIECDIIESDRIRLLTWSNAPSEWPARLLTSEHQLLDITSVDLIWWRRFTRTQKRPASVTDPAEADLINNDTRESFLGILFTRFNGAWVSRPDATQRAENKLLQLQVAELCGLRTPRTLVSQDPNEIRRFSRTAGSRMVIKAVKGTQRRGLSTVALNPQDLPHDESLQLAPAMYQEFIPGTKHLRVNCFGETVLAAQIDAEEVDWRYDLTVPIYPHQINNVLHDRLISVLQHLDLRMGIFDLKLDESGEPIFLEVNPQGQFLFLEGICGLKLTGAFCNFISNDLKHRGPQNRMLSSDGPPDVLSDHLKSGHT